MKTKGTVKWFNDDKGYGFLECDAHDEDVFVHHTQIQMDGFRTLKENQNVTFELKEGPKGFHANDVSPQENAHV